MSANIRFRNEYVLEDTDFLVECTSRAQRIGTVKEIMYIYRDSGGSLSKIDQPLKYIHNQLSAMCAIYERTHFLPNYKGIKDAVEFAMLHLYTNVVNTCMNLVYLKEQEEEDVIAILRNLKSIKDEMITGGYDGEYIKKGINSTNLAIIKANDISPEAVLSMLKDR